MKIKRYNNEDRIPYIIRACEAKGTDDWETVAENIREELNEDYSSSAYRKLYQSYNMVKDSLKDTAIEEQLQELEELRDEIYRERCKLSDANRENNKYRREQSRTEIIIEEMQHIMKDMPKFTYKKCNYNYGTNLEASILISDIHYGIEIDNIKNFYNTNICQERLNELRDKVIDRCKAHKVDKLNVCILGDDISGLIHFSTIAENNRDIITQCIEVSELLSNFVMQLSEEIPNVKVYTTYGNHSRVWQNKSNGSNKENYERIVAEFLKTRLKPYGIKVIDSGWEDFIVTKIAGRTIVMVHGDKDGFNKVAGDFAKLLRQPIDEVYMSHYHAHREQDDCGTQVIINGSLVSTDDYAMTLRKHTDAVQLLRIYGEDVCCYRLKLK